MPLRFWDSSQLTIRPLQKDRHLLVNRLMPAENASVKASMTPMHTVFVRGLSSAVERL